ncbi:polysaccharide deacetylase family protein [Goodfellowiella coeruleoviolacea]|uniref:Polysaccharide deacetylase n=1 Tax=Goodfellowiella coeruleoviolacea TaxID=334858 RepID=A0AAE3KJC8_9PSEU|nr:polysaccharide deacetylase [Goodfellowiella coeruleoviolacea]MCP2170121.1 Polysaccharide deacetylase [Goodfellowiella coeruleoviolacea]
MSRPAWLGDAKAVAALTFDVDAETPVLAADPRYAHHPMVMSHQSYGPDVGVPRILDVLDEFDVPATFFIPGWVAAQRPGLAASIVERGHEVAQHTHAHRAPTSMTPDEERADFERAVAVFAEQDIPVRGYRAAMWGASALTPDLVAEHGLRYDSSLMGDDRPYALATARGPIAELPVHWSLDDWEQYAFLPEPDIGRVIESPRKVAEMWRAELDGMRHFGCLFTLCCHPFLSGRPGRLMALRGLIQYALDCGDVRFTRCDELAEAVLADPGITPRPLPPPPVYP